MTKEKIKLNSTIRETVGKGVGALRREGSVPAVMYGRNKKATNLKVDALEFNRVLKEAGKSSIVELTIEGDGKKNILIHDLQYNALTEEPTHADFYEVSMTEKITATVPLVFVGDSKAVIDLGGSLTTNLSELEIECLPGDLPHEIEVDVTVLETFENTIHVKDIILPSGVETKEDLDTTVASVDAPRTEEEMEELEAPVEENLPSEEQAEAGETEEKTE